MNKSLRFWAIFFEQPFCDKWPYKNILKKFSARSETNTAKDQKTFLVSFPALAANENSIYLLRPKVPIEKSTIGSKNKKDVGHKPWPKMNHITKKKFGLSRSHDFFHEPLYVHIQTHAHAHG